LTAPESPKAPEHVIVGRIRRAHGVRGEVAVELITDEPDAIFASGLRVFAGNENGNPTRDPATGKPVELHITGVRPFQEGALVTFAEITDRTIAQRWHGRYLVVPFEELPLPEEGAVYLHELAGMTVLDPGGGEAGTIRAYYELPHGIVLEIDTPNGPRDVPFNEAFVGEIDRVARTMVVRPPEESRD
jgi:16S rRNA processing protein RimM